VSGWYPDPTGRFEYRYFNGRDWTTDVSTGGRRFIDPLDGRSPTPTPTPVAQGSNGIALAGGLQLTLCCDLAVASADAPPRFDCSPCRSAIAAFCSAALSVFPSCLVEVLKLEGDGATDVRESEHPAKMSRGKARISNDARFDSSRGMASANLSLV